MTKIIRTQRLVALAGLTALAALALATAGGVAAAPGQGKAKGLTKGYKVSRGATTLTIDQTLTDGFTAGGAALTVLTPAKGDPPALPVTNGRVKVTKTGDAVSAVAGKISHTGGISVTEGESSSVLRNPRIVLDDSPDLTAQVWVNDSPLGRTSVADLDVDLAKITVTTVGKKRWLEIKDVEATLNADSIGALNATFGTTFAAGQKLGELDVKARIVGRRK